MKLSSLFRAAVSVAALFFFLAATGCLGGAGTASVPVPTDRGESMNSQDYRIRPLDTLRFGMYAEPDNRGE